MKSEEPEKTQGIGGAPRHYSTEIAILAVAVIIAIAVASRKR